MNSLILPTRLVKGRWSNIRIFETPDTFAKAQRGEAVKCWALPDIANGITDVGIHYLVEAGFRDGAKVTAWYAGLIDNAGYTGVAAGDTSASHTGWPECTTYDEANRQTLSFRRLPGPSRLRFRSR